MGESHKSTIYLVRHGQSAANVAQINLPPHEDVLTDTGRQQADLLGKHLKDVVFTKAFASTYARSQDTAKAVLTNSNMTDKPELKIDPRIHERTMGDFVGKPAKEAFMALFMAVKQGTPIVKFEIPGGETVKEFDGRIDSFLKDLIKELQESTKPETVLIVSHGLTILRLLTKLQETDSKITLQSFAEADASTPMANTSYHVFTVQPPPKDCVDGDTCMEFLKYHQNSHLESMQTPTDITGSLASGFAKLKQMDANKNMAECKQQ